MALTSIVLEHDVEPEPEVEPGLEPGLAAALVLAPDGGDPDIELEPPAPIDEPPPIPGIDPDDAEPAGPGPDDVDDDPMPGDDVDAGPTTVTVCVMLGCMAQ
jgi:hypothetical protein